MNVSDKTIESANNSNYQPTDNQLFLVREIDKLLSPKKEILSNSMLSDSQRFNQVNQLYIKAEAWLLATSDDKKVYSTLLNLWGRFLNQCDAYSDAEQVFLKKVRVDEQLYGAEHEETAYTYDKLGSVYELLDKGQQALDCYYKELAIREKVLGPNHLLTADSYRNIATVYMDFEEMHETAKALEYFQKALDIYEATDGADKMTIDDVKDYIEDMKERLEEEKAGVYEDSPKETPQEDSPKKKSFFQRLFGK